MSLDTPVFTKVLPELKQHPLFSGHHSVAIMTGENPMVHPALEGGNGALKQLLKEQDLPYEETDGLYGLPEKSLIIHGPTTDQAFHLGRALGQESVVFSHKGQHSLLFTHGPNAGKYHPAHPQYSFDPQTPFPDNWTHLPGHGYLRLYFDSNRLLPAALSPGAMGPAPMIRKALAKAIRDGIELATKSDGGK